MLSPRSWIVVILAMVVAVGAVVLNLAKLRGQSNKQEEIVFDVRNQMPDGFRYDAGNGLIFVETEEHRAIGWWL